MNLKNLILPVFLVVIFASCNQTQKPSNKDAADAIYFGGDIITMEGDSSKYAEAVAVKNGKIIFVGKKDDADKLKGDSTKMNDLKGKTMLPGFIDPHSHFINALSITSQANCSPSPVGEANDVNGIVTTLKKLKEDKKIADGELIMGYGYDENAMPNGTTLNRDDLDKAFPNNPNIGEVNLRKNDTIKAFENFDKAILTMRELGIKYYLCSFLFRKAEAEFQINNLKEAESLNSEALEIAKQIDRKDIIFKTETLAQSL